LLFVEFTVVAGNTANKKCHPINPPAALFHRNQRESEIMKRIRGHPKAGFTQVEIMIVVAVIGLLSAIAIPNFVRVRPPRAMPVSTTCASLTTPNSNGRWNKRQSQHGHALSCGNRGLRWPAGNVMPNEPLDGSYSILAVSIAPSCSKEDDVLHKAVLPF
jgi:prepilin-type N-terminal cleavage/methylation domain-containing protein